MLELDTGVPPTRRGFYPYSRIETEPRPMWGGLRSRQAERGVDREPTTFSHPVGRWW